jgi:hypothetical protein
MKPKPTDKQRLDFLARVKCVELAKGWRTGRWYVYFPDTHIPDTSARTLRAAIDKAMRQEQR